MRHDQKFIIAPATHLLRRTQALRHGVPYLFEHCIARGNAVRLAQFFCLIDADPQNSQRRPAAHEVVELRLQSLFQFSATLRHFRRFVRFAVRQRVKALRRVEQQSSADTFAQPIAQNQNPHDHRHRMAQLMPHLRQRPPALYHCSRRARLLLAASRRKQRPQALGKLPPLQFQGRITADALRRLVPEHHCAIPVKKAYAFRNVVECGFE